MSERTIYRDIKSLMASGVPIEGEAGVGYALRRGYQLPPLMFDEEEVEALLFGVDVARTYGDTRLATAAESILAGRSRPPERLRPQLVGKRLFVPEFQANPDVAEMLGEVRGAINPHAAVPRLSGRRGSWDRAHRSAPAAHLLGYDLGAWCLV